jgi:hypothetical protein
MKTDIAYIYALLDPRDNQVRYIGKTTNPKNRLSGHITECKKDNVTHYRAMWIKSLIREKLKPSIKFLKICPLSEFSKYEAEYINLYKNNKLTNSDETGQGNVNRVKDVIDRMLKPKSREVYQYDLDGNFLYKYKSVREASRVLSMYHSNISRCCNGISNHTGGFIFRYNEIIVTKVSNPNAVKKSVIEIDNIGNKIGEWVSIMECSRDTGIDSGNLSKVCNGKIKSIKGRFFRFLKG